MAAEAAAQRRAPASASPGPALPPVNHNSTLVAGFGPRPALDSAKEQAAANDSASFNFGRLRSLLPTENDGDAMMRKSSSTPAALSKMGLGLAAGLNSPKSRLAGGPGPMRRVSTFSTPLTARRMNSFMWTMDVHRDFETAVQTLASRVRAATPRLTAPHLRARPCLHCAACTGTRLIRFWPFAELPLISAQGRDVSEIGPAEVLGLMKYAGADGLTESSIERHLQVRASLPARAGLVQHVGACSVPVACLLPTASWPCVSANRACACAAPGRSHSCRPRHRLFPGRRTAQKRAALQQKLATMLPPPPQHRPRASVERMEQSIAEAPAIAENDAALAAAAAANEALADSLTAAMARQQAMQRQMLEQQRAMQMKALDQQPVATST